MHEPSRQHYYHITPEAFVSAWQSSTNTLEVSQKLGGMPNALIHARAYAYRKRGVHLKKLQPLHHRINAEELNAVTES